MVLENYNTGFLSLIIDLMEFGHEYGYEENNIETSLTQQGSSKMRILWIGKEDKIREEHLYLFNAENKREFPALCVF